jgi:hypothetical protein
MTARHEVTQPCALCPPKLAGRSWYTKTNKTIGKGSHCPLLLPLFPIGKAFSCPLPLPAVPKASSSLLLSSGLAPQFCLLKAGTQVLALALAHPSILPRADTPRLRSPEKTDFMGDLGSTCHTVQELIGSSSQLLKCAHFSPFMTHADDNFAYW